MPPNLANYYAPERNRLLNAQAQQTLDTGRQTQALNEMDMMGRASQGLLNLGDEQSRAAAYPGIVQQLQGMGFAKNAPATYPGRAALKQLVAQSMSVPDPIQDRLCPRRPARSLQSFKSNAPLGMPGPTAGTGEQRPRPGSTARWRPAEGGGKSNAINPQGYTGAYQFGKQRLAQLGYYTPAPRRGHERQHQVGRQGLGAGLQCHRSAVVREQPGGAAGGVQHASGQHRQRDHQHPRR